jgi:hypothetical protein
MPLPVWIPLPKLTFGATDVLARTAFFTVACVLMIDFF